MDSKPFVFIHTGDIKLAQRLVRLLHEHGINGFLGNGQGGAEAGAGMACGHSDPRSAIMPN